MSNSKDRRENDKDQLRNGKDRRENDIDQWRNGKDQREMIKINGGIVKINGK